MWEVIVTRDDQSGAICRSRSESSKIRTVVFFGVYLSCWSGGTVVYEFLKWSDLADKNICE